jgi:hypothetical protein
MPRNEFQTRTVRLSTAADFNALSYYTLCQLQDARIGANPKEAVLASGKTLTVLLTPDGTLAAIVSFC